MNVVKKTVFIIYKEYKHWEDDDSNRTELVHAFSESKKAMQNLFDEFKNEVQFFIDNEIELLNKSFSNTGYVIETRIGNVECYLKEKNVN